MPYLKLLSQLSPHRTHPPRVITPFTWVSIQQPSRPESDPPIFNFRIWIRIAVLSTADGRGRQDNPRDCLKHLTYASVQSACGFFDHFDNVLQRRAELFRFRRPAVDFQVAPKARLMMVDK